MILTADDLRDYLIEAVDNGTCSRNFANELLDHFDIPMLTRTFNFSVEYRFVDILRGSVEAVDKSAAEDIITDLIDNSEINIVTTVKVKSIENPDVVEVDDYTDSEAEIDEESLYAYECKVEIWESE